MSERDKILHEFENAGAKEKPTPFDPRLMADEIEKLRKDYKAERLKWSAQTAKLCEAMDREQALEKKLDRLEERRCGKGHDNHLPLRLWDCPTCHEETKKNLKSTEDKLVDRRVRIDALENEMASLTARIDQIHAWGNELESAKKTMFDYERELLDARKFGKTQAKAAECAEQTIKKLEADLEGWDQSLALMRRREQPWIEEWRKEEPGRELQLPDYGKIMEWITQRAERAEAEARKFYDGDGDYKILPAEEVKAKRIACALELTILRAETYARTTAPLSPEERASLSEGIEAYEKADEDGIGRIFVMGKLHRKIEKMMQGRSLVRSSSQSGMSVAAEEAIETFLPVLTKARAMKVQAEKGAIPATTGLAQVVEVFETAMKKMEVMKLIADSAPRPGDGPPCRQCEGSGEVKDFHEEGPPTKVPCPGCDPAYKEAERFIEAAPDSMENCLNHPDTSWIDVCTGCLATRIMRSEDRGRAMAPVLLIKARHIVKRIGAWEMDEATGLMSIEETLEIKEDLVNAIADTKGEADAEGQG